MFEWITKNKQNTKLKEELEYLHLMFTTAQKEIDKLKLKIRVRDLKLTAAEETRQQEDKANTRIFTRHQKTYRDLKDLTEKYTKLEKENEALKADASKAFAEMIVRKLTT